MDDCEEFSVMDIIISLRLVEGARDTSDGSKPSSFVLLREDGSRGELRRIYFEEEGAFVIWSL